MFEIIGLFVLRVLGIAKDIPYDNVFGNGNPFLFWIGFTVVAFMTAGFVVFVQPLTEGGDVQIISTCSFRLLELSSNS